MFFRNFSKVLLASLALQGGVYAVDDDFDFAEEGLETIESDLFEAAKNKKPGKALRMRMIQMCHAYGNIVRDNYAMHEVKKQYYDWTVRKAVVQARSEISKYSSVPTLKEFQHVLLRFFNSMKDYHVSIQFAATEMASLPFVLEEAEGRFFVDKLYGPNIGILPGDEVIAFDGIPLATVVDEIQAKYERGAHSLSDRGLALSKVTMRSAAEGVDVPQGSVVVTVNKQDGTLVDIPFTWFYQDEVATDPYQKFYPAHIAHRLDPRLDDHSIEDRKLVTAYNAVVNKWYGLADLPRLRISNKESRLPELGQVYWNNFDTDAEHQAYIFQGPHGHLLGFVRIPHYTTNDIETLEQTIAMLEDYTEALIIDQLDNGGGYLHEVNAICSMLADKTFSLPLEREKLTQVDVINWYYLLKYMPWELDVEELKEYYPGLFSGYEWTNQDVANFKVYLERIVSEWQEGNTFTSLGSLHGFTEIQPHPDVRYTKPVLMLINEQDYSGGDFCPGILKENGRVTLMGTRTAGAGGYVKEQGFGNTFGLGACRLTGSVAYMKDGSTLEDLGVEPHIPYRFTVEDLQNDYAPLAQRVLEEVEKLLH